MKVKISKLIDKLLMNQVSKDLGNMAELIVSLIRNFIKQILEFIVNIPSRLWSIPVIIKSIPLSIKSRIKQDEKKKKYRSFRLQKKIKPEPRYIPSSYKLLRSSIIFILKNYKVFLYILLIHVFFYLLIIRSPVNTDISTIQDSIKTVLGENNSKSLGGNLVTLGAVIGSGGGSTQGGAIQGIATLLVILVNIWAIRQIHNKQKIKARDAYYQGLTPLLPALIILIVIAIQVIPFAIAALVYSTARSGGLFATGFEDLSFFIFSILVGLLSLYWITTTIVAFFVVTLPGMYPINALKSAKNIVQFQRFTVFKRLVSLPVLLIALYLSGLLLIIRIIPSQAFLFAELYSILVIPLACVYLYKLYRALI